jgi:hypothetical protein
LGVPWGLPMAAPASWLSCQTKKARIARAPIAANPPQRSQGWKRFFAGAAGGLAYVLLELFLLLLDLLTGISLHLWSR